MLAVLTRSLALLLAVAAPALAQAPRITPAGDPTVRNDTIYRLAVNPADHPDDDYIYLLDDGVVRLEADGRGSRTYRQVVQILTRAAAETWGEQSFSYVSGRERLTLNWVRVVKPTGEVISSQPAHQQESIAPVAQEAPVFSDAKVRRVSSGGIAPGTLLDYSYTVETLKPVMPSDFQRGWRVTTGRLTRRSRYVVEVPTNLDVRIKEVNLTFPRKTAEARGRRVYTWATADVPKIEREPFAADSNGIDQYIDIAAPVQWSDVARWYGGHKATLFIALARRLGLRAYPVLLSSSGGIARDRPSALAFDHMIAAVERPGGYLYLDLTSELTPFGSLPPAEQGEFGLMVHPDGSGEEVTFPADSAATNRDVAVLTGDLSPRGVFHGRYVHVAAGDQQYGMRQTFATPFGTTERERITRAAVNMLFPGATGDSLELFDGRDLRAEPRIAVVIREAQATSQSGSSDILTLPIHNYGDVKGVAAELEARGPRRFPIDVAAVAGPHEEAAELKLTLPDGWRAQLPPNITARSAFGTYSAEYGQEGRVLRVARKLIGRKGIEPPGRIGDLIQWLKEMAKDDVRYIVLEHPR